jgi:Holliday junction resolvase RusA-like endonuclease
MVGRELKELQPPDGGEVSLLVQLPPVSIQASRRQKEILTGEIRNQLSNFHYILTGETKVDIEWMIHDRDRYETGDSPDVDNILKPAIDALAGKNGIMIDDSQVQAISCRWIDWIRKDQQFRIMIQFRPDEWLEKADLVFVRISEQLYMPLNDSMPSEGLDIILSGWELMFATRNKLLELGSDHYSSLGVLSVQRAFHKNRIAGRFPLFDLTEFRARHGLSANSRRGEKLRSH